MKRMTHSKKNRDVAFTSGKAFVIALIIVLTAGYSHAQLFGKKEGNYTPILEIPGTTFKPSGIPIQEKYNGKIVFSNEQLTKENTTEDKFKTTLDLGAPIWARVFITNQVGNYMVYNNFYCKTPCEKDASHNTNDDYTLSYYIDDSLLYSSVYRNTSEDGLDGVQTWQRSILVPSLSTDDWRSFRDELNNLTPGIHKVKVIIHAGNKNRFGISYKPIAEGEFDLNVADNSKIKIGKKWSDNQNGKMASDAKVKAKLIELSAADMKTNYPDITVKGTKILSDDYSIQKEYNYPKFRYVQVAVYGTDSKSGKCFVYYRMYAQDYAGGGNYSSDFYQWGHTNETEVDCE